MGYLISLEKKLVLYSPIDGVIITSGLPEKVGRYYNEGELILEVVKPTVLEAEIALPERDVSMIRPGQRILLKMQAQPYQTFEAEVDRISPLVEMGDQESVARVYGQLKRENIGLLPGMSGYARIYLERRPAGLIMLEKVMRFVRTEFWW